MTGFGMLSSCAFHGMMGVFLGGLASDIAGAIRVARYDVLFSY